jgi:hypothetical protein
MLASVRALSSAGERSLHTGEVAGSIPAAPTIIAIQVGDAANARNRSFALAHHRLPEIGWLSPSRSPHDVTRKHLLQTIARRGVQLAGGWQNRKRKPFEAERRCEAMLTAFGNHLTVAGGRKIC